MTIPKNTDLLGMDYGFAGEPFVSIPAKSTIILDTMDYGFQGQPFVPNPQDTQTTSISKIAGVAHGAVGKISFTSYAALQKVLGVEV